MYCYTPMNFDLFELHRKQKISGHFLGAIMIRYRCTSNVIYESVSLSSGLHYDINYVMTDFGVLDCIAK